MQCIRVITHAKPMTRDRALAEQEVAVDILATNAVQKSATWAQSGTLVSCCGHDDGSGDGLLFPPL